MLKSIRIIGHVFRKELRLVVRDRQMMVMILIMPVIQVILLGYAITVDVKYLPLGVVDYDRSPESRRLIEDFRHNDTFEFRGNLAGPESVRESLDSGEISVALIIPPGFARKLGRGESVDIQMLMDGVDSNASLIAAAHSRGITEAYALNRFREGLSGLELPDMQPRLRIFYNPALESRFYMVPGIVVILLTMLTSLVTGVGLVRERETGTLEQISVTPIKTFQLMLGKVLPFVFIGYIALSIAISVCLLWFGVPMRGSWGLLVAFSFLFLFNTLGLGLLVSTVARSQQQALFMIWFILIFGILMSGLFFPIENMPDIMQKLTYINPLRYFLTIVRGLFLKGSGLGAFHIEAAGLALLGPLALLMAGLRFSKQAK